MGPQANLCLLPARSVGGEGDLIINLAHVVSAEQGWEPIAEEAEASLVAECDEWRRLPKVRLTLTSILGGTDETGSSDSETIEVRGAAAGALWEHLQKQAVRLMPAQGQASNLVRCPGSGQPSISIPEGQACSICLIHPQPAGLVPDHRPRPPAVPWSPSVAPAPFVPLEESIAAIVASFDFDKVHRAMVALNWRWESSVGQSVQPYLPTVPQLKEAAAGALRVAAVRGFWGADGFLSRRCGGGFRAQRDERRQLALLFIVETMHEEEALIHRSDEAEGRAAADAKAGSR